MLDPSFQIALYKKLLRVRHAEQELAERYKKQEMRTPTHFGLGQEAVAVGVCEALNIDDVVYSHHRSHNHFLAKGGKVGALAAELFGRVTGCSKGRGGSVHLTDRSCGFIASSAILGEAMAASTGSALAFKMDQSSRVSVSFFGDAVAEEGAFYECLSYAALHQLPVLFVCENNGYATESSFETRQPKDVSIHGRVAAFGIQTFEVDGNDVCAVYETTQKALGRLRAGGGPVFIEAETYRWLEHVGPHYDHALGRTYRTEEEVSSWQDRDPVKKQAARIVDQGWLDEPALKTLDADSLEETLNAIDEAFKAPWPEVDTLYDNVT